MKRATQLGLLLAGLGWAAATAHADAVGDYKVILDRNPFGLKPPPAAPAPPTNAPPETPTNYKLSGITALFNPPRAMFVNQVPGKPAPEYLSLSEGQRQGSLEVLTDGINLKAGTVRVKISGEERTMSFEKDGLKATPGPPIMPPPGTPMPFGMPNPVQPTPLGTQAPAVPVPGQNPGFRPAGVIPGAAPQPNMPTVLPTPARPMRIPLTTGQNLTDPPPAAIIDPVEQTVRMEIQRKLDEPRVAAGQVPPLPPTDLTGR